MLNLFDYLSPLDNKRIENYIQLYGVEDNYIGNQEFLAEWAKNKKKLFHLLGGNLVYKFPFKIEKSASTISAEVRSKVLFHSFVEKYKEKARLLYEDTENKYFTYENFYRLLWLVEEGCLSSHKINFSYKWKKNADSPMLQITEGGKPLKAIQKVLKYYDWYDELKAEFDDFSNIYSNIFTEKELSGNLCISIHPLDYMTMSDNANNWHSCMSWMKEGCYRAGTLEMLTSNNVVCCYIESSTPFIFTEEKTEGPEYTWNSKSWRQLFYVTKDIVLGGKAYPYINKTLTLLVLNKIKELTETNLHKTYQFGPEPYQDMKWVGSMYRMDKAKSRIASKDTFKHNILFDTKGMYNDLFNFHPDSKPDTYMCYRNKVKKTIMVSASGKAPCLCCGGPVISEKDMEYDYDGAYNERFDNVNALICEDCQTDRYCSCCNNPGGYKKTYKIGSRYYCKECAELYLKKCPDCGKWFRVSNVYDVYYARLTNEKIYTQDLYLQNLNGSNPKLQKICICGECKTKRFHEFPDTKLEVDPSIINYDWRTSRHAKISEKIYTSEEASKYQGDNLEPFSMDSLN